MTMIFLPVGRGRSAAARPCCEGYRFAKGRSAECVPSTISSSSRKRERRAGKASRWAALGKSSSFLALCRVPAECAELIFAPEGGKGMTLMTKE
jgi:hypothetical protein